MILALGAALSVLVLAMVLTPVAGWLLDTLYEATPALRAGALATLLLLVPVPVVFTANALLRGKLIARRQTRLVQRAGLLDLAVMSAVLGLGILWPVALPHPAAPTLGAVTMLAVYATDFLILGWGVRTHQRVEG